LVIGEVSFGKGLVQAVYNLADNTGLALTVARYYTPSGRLIQRDYNGVSLYNYYYNRGTQPAGDREVKLTDGGRTVYGGGGITPDEKVETPKLDHFQETVLSHYVFFNFAKHYLLNKHITKDFAVNDEIMQDFRKFLTDQKVTYSDADLAHDLDWVKTGVKGELFTAEFGQEEGLKARAQSDPMIQKALGMLPEAKQVEDNARRVMAQRRAGVPASQ
jgi:carboxyl-terminal processing protease